MSATVDKKQPTKHKASRNNSSSVFVEDTKVIERDDSALFEEEIELTVSKQEYDRISGILKNPPRPNKKLAELFKNIKN